MIVICTKCQAKFRVADDKIGPRGAKVRCSKCQTVFLVHPVLGTVPVTDGDARHAARPPSPPAPAAVPEPAADPFAAAPPAADPFGPPRDDPFAPPAAPAADPFGGADPFAAAPPSANAGGLGDPFVAAVAHRSTLPVTDLSDLMGPAAATPPPLPPPRAAPAAADPFAASAPAPAAAEPAAGPPVLEDPFAARPAAAPEQALADPFASEDPFAAAPPPLPGAAGEPPGPAPAQAEPDLELAAPSAGPSLDDGGLALEDRLTPPPSRIATPSSAAPPPDPTLEAATPAPAGGGGPDPFAAFGAAPAGGAAEPFDPGAFDFGGAGAGDLGGPEPDLAEPSPAAAASPPPPPPRPRGPAPDAAHPSAEAAAAPAAAVAGASSTPALEGGEAADRIPGARTSRLRAVAVNAVALFAVIVVALAIWAVWRTDGPLEAASLRPSAILAALGRGSAAGPWTAQDVRSGVYDRVRGAPLLFVRGRVVSRATAPVPRVKVAVQVVRGGQVLARGEALAGAVPTEEDLYLAADDATIAAVRRAAEARAPAAVRPGDAVPFLVAIGDAPPDLQGATLRIDVAPAGGAAP